MSFQKEVRVDIYLGYIRFHAYMLGHAYFLKVEESMHAPTWKHGYGCNQGKYLLETELEKALNAFRRKSSLYSPCALDYDYKSNLLQCMSQ